jgi:hypothetical protein
MPSRHSAEKKISMGSNKYYRFRGRIIFQQVANSLFFYQDTNKKKGYEKDLENGKYYVMIKK